MPKKISCKVVQTRLYYPTDDLFIARPWGENGLPNPKAPIVRKEIGNIDKMFNNLIRESGLLDYYA